MNILFFLSLIDLAWFQGRINNKQIEKLHAISLVFPLGGILRGYPLASPERNPPGDSRGDPLGHPLGNPLGDPPGRPPGGHLGRPWGDPPGETMFDEHQITINYIKYIT